MPIYYLLCSQKPRSIRPPIDNILSKTGTFFTSYLLFFQSIINIAHSFHPHNTVLQIYDFFLIRKENFHPKRQHTVSHPHPVLRLPHPALRPPHPGLRPPHPVLRASPPAGKVHPPQPPVVTHSVPAPYPLRLFTGCLTVFCRSKVGEKSNQGRMEGLGKVGGS